MKVFAPKVDERGNENRKEKNWKKRNEKKVEWLGMRRNQTNKAEILTQEPDSIIIVFGECIHSILCCHAMGASW